MCLDQVIALVVVVKFVSSMTNKRAHTSTRRALSVWLVLEHETRLTAPILPSDWMEIIILH